MVYFEFRFASLISEHRQQSSSKPQSQKAAATSPTRKNNSKSAPESHTKCNDSEDEGFDTTEPTTTPAVTTRYAEGCLRRLVTCIRGCEPLQNSIGGTNTKVVSACVASRSMLTLVCSGSKPLDMLVYTNFTIEWPQRPQA